MTPDDGFDAVAVTGRAAGGGAGTEFGVCFLLAFSDLCAASADSAVRGVDVSADVCRVGLAGLADFPDLSAESALLPSRMFSDEEGFAGLCGGCSDWRSPFAGFSGFGPDCACAGAFSLSASCAVCAAAMPKVIAEATTAIAASKQHLSRKAFTDTDLSAVAR